MKKYTSTLAILIAGILWGIIVIFTSVLSEAGLSALQITAVREMVAAPIFVIATLIRDRSLFKIKLRDIWMFIGTGIISVVLFNCCYFYAMVQSQRSIAVVLLYTSPVFILLLSALLFKERITAVKLIALIMTVAGCVLVAGLIGGVGSIRPVILLIGMGAGFFYGLYTIFGRFALAKYDTLTVTTYTFIFAMIGAVPFSGIGSVFSIVSASPSLLLWCVGIGALCTAAPYFLYTWGLKHMESSRASILAFSEPLVGAVIGITFYRESHDTLKLVGIALILAAIILMNIKPAKNKTLKGATHEHL